ncbi:hypothetical protein SEA_CHERRYONLIM_12 [Gordonia phage CherryonLim]|uniref:Uncharacterized protein n=1 Tax=Gordonia phage CherryonLim TaxID=2652411 RepID=A0A5P8D9U1_9CAUD|nr:neck protein [Gordonia phage CherryonLim]QFP95765.1 hypothetical protein SEA_CHERRYONLIM_12 [Gordonia phage CherryonLim]
MANRVRLNHKGFRAIRSAPKLVRLEERIGKGIADRANAGLEKDGYIVESKEGAPRPQGRHRVTVYTGTPEAMKDNATNNTLLREFFNARR